MDAFTAIFDSCVFYSAPLRDILLELSGEGIFRARWTHQIHDEWIRNVLANNSHIKPEQLARTRQLMDRAVPECLILGYEHLINSVNLPDNNDRHVLAAAIVARAGVIVTFNTKDFPEHELKPYGLKAQHPDDFLISQFDLANGPVCAAIKRLRSRLKNPPMNVAAYLANLRQQQLLQFEQRLQLFKDVI
jgi:hypothetical protein